ncbi:MAG: hypothetical protein RR450_07365 [Oscillospiraceae bacterium]
MDDNAIRQLLMQQASQPAAAAGQAAQQFVPQTEGHRSYGYGLSPENVRAVGQQGMEAQKMQMDAQRNATRDAMALDEQTFGKIAKAQEVVMGERKLKLQEQVAGVEMAATQARLGMESRRLGMAESEHALRREQLQLQTNELRNKAKALEVADGVVVSVPVNKVGADGKVVQSNQPLALSTLRSLGMENILTDQLKLDAKLQAKAKPFTDRGFDAADAITLSDDKYGVTPLIDSYYKTALKARAESKGLSGEVRPMKPEEDVAMRKQATHSAVQALKPSLSEKGYQSLLKALGVQPVEDTKSARSLAVDDIAAAIKSSIKK